MRPVIFFRWLLFSWRFLGTCAVVLLCVAAGVSVVSRAFVAPVEAASAVDKAAARYVETTEGRTAYLAVLQARFRADAADPAEQARVERLLVPLATAAGRTLPLVVVSSEDKVNAYALPDAFVVHHGMLALLTNDGELSVLLAHELGHLPYSVEEIYGIHVSGKYQSLRQTYNEFYRLYGTPIPKEDVYPKRIITEDSNSGFDFFSAVAQSASAECLSAGGSSQIFTRLKALPDDVCTLIIADGAAFGPEMERVEKELRLHPQTYLYLPESFEWLILKSGLLDSKELRDLLERPAEYIESSQFFS